MTTRQQLQQIEESLLAMHSGIITAMQLISDRLATLAAVNREAADAVIAISQQLDLDRESDPYNLFGGDDDA